MGNVIQSAWEGVATVRDAVELLEAFDSLAKRQGMARDVRNKARTSNGSAACGADLHGTI